MTSVRRRRPAMESSDDDDDAPSPRAPRSRDGVGAFSGSSSSGGVAVGPSAAPAAESRVKKVIVRSIMGFLMVTGFVGIVWAGHLYLSALVVLIQVGVDAVSCTSAVGVAVLWLAVWPHRSCSVDAAVIRVLLYRAICILCTRIICII